MKNLEIKNIIWNYELQENEEALPTEMYFEVDDSFDNKLIAELMEDIEGAEPKSFDCTVKCNYNV
jgi:hypothetical protein